MQRYKEYVIDNPRLMKEWDYEENKRRCLDPTKLTIGSGQKPSWICEQGHRWDASINHRVIRGQNCPYCSNKKILAGYNDLKSQCPEVMKDWDYDNNIINPESVAAKSNKIANWICPKGHKYSKRICNRTMGEGCPICNKARKTSFPEQCFFFYTKKVFPDAINGYKEIFDKQMELDIYIPSLKTGIEYDGVFWHGADDIDVATREKKKYIICKENSIRLLRIKEGEFKGFSDTAEHIWYIQPNCEYEKLNVYITEYLKYLTFSSIKLPIVDVERDKKEILEYKTLRFEDSLLFLNPELAKEWHPTKNGKLTPDLFHPGSSEEVWWKCAKCGNDWKSIIYNRVKGHGCNKCAMADRKKTQKETLLSNRKTIIDDRCLKDWDYELNAFGPEHYTHGSGKKVVWRCHICGYRWEAVICDRGRGYKNGCPFCAGKIILKGINDLATLHPDLMYEWDYENNVEVNPSCISAGSHQIVSWICKKCTYRWDAQIYNRVNGKGCPCCANRVVVSGINDLATTEPTLAKEWHPTLNDLKPTEVTRGQAKTVWWQCSECGNIWQDTINHRSNGRGCSVCKKLKKKNDKK